MSSLKMTFSLTSLIFLLVLGLIFVPTSVMAHEVTDANTGAGQPHAADTPAGATHSHPGIMVTIADADDRTSGTQVVDTGADEAATPLDFTAAVTPTLQFDVTLTVPVGAEDSTSAVSANTFGTADVPIVAYKPDFTTAGQIAFDTFALDDATGAPRAWTATATLTLAEVPFATTGADAAANAVLTEAAYHKAVADAIEAGIMVDITVNAELIEATGLVGGPMAGHSNLGSKTTVSVVAPPDTTAPALRPTVGDPDATTGAIMVTFAFDEAFTTTPTVTDMTAADSGIAGTYMVSAVTASDDMMSFTVTVTPDAATETSGDIPSGTVTLGISGTDDDGNAIAADTTVHVMLAARPFSDTQPPAVVILPNPDRQSAAFPISFTVRDNYSEAADITVAVAITPATAVTEAAPTAMVQPDGSYMVTVTPVAATEAMTPIPASTITVTVTATDEATNPGRDSEFFFLAEREYEDETAPALRPTVGDPDATTGAIMVTLAFDETFTTAPTVTDMTAADSMIAGTYMVSAVTGSGMSFMVTVTPDAATMESGDIPAGTVMLGVSGTDDDGNAIAAGTTVDVMLAARTAPTDTDAPTFTSDAPTEPISTATVVNLTFTEAVTGVSVTGTPSMDDAKYTAVVAGSGMAYTVTITPISRDNLAEDMGQRIITFAVSGADAANNSVDGSFSLILAARKVAPVDPPDPPGPTPRPTFADAAVTVPALTVGTAMTPVSLPQASGGVGALKHTLRVGLKDVTTSGYNGLMLDEANVALMGTPIKADATGTIFTWRATDANNNFADLTFTVVVNPKPTEPPKPVDPTVITVAPKSQNLDRVGILHNEFKVGPAQRSFELTLTHADPRNLIGIWVSGRDYDRSKISFVQNTGTPTSWTLRIAISNPNPVQSFDINVFVRNRTLYQLATPDLNDPTKNVDINNFEVQVDNEGPRVNFIDVYRLIPAVGGPFNVRIQFNETLQAAPAAGNFTITNGSISDFRLLSAEDEFGRPTYLALITPAHGVGPTAAVGKRNVEIRLNNNLADKYGNLSLATAADAVADQSFVIKKATVAPTVTPTPAVGDIAATPSADGMTVTLSGKIGANDFAVIGAASLPDLQEFFDVGGTIDLNNGDTTDDKNLRNVVISEILWGLDYGATAITDQKQWQFIELYNTTGAEIDVTGWTLTFTEGRPSTDAIDIDQVSNRPPLHVGWVVDIGQSGRVTGTRAVDLDSTITAINVVSMYRNIDYAKVEKPDHDANATENRKKQLDGFPSGNAKGSWKASTRRDPNTPAGVGVTGTQAARWVYATRGEKHYTTTAILTASTVSRSPFIINEVGNGSGDTNDWVEIHNLDSGEKSLKNYHLSAVTAVGTDNSLVNFHDKDIKVPGNGFILLVNTSPTTTDLAAGRNAAIAADDQILTGVNSIYYVNGNLKLPDDGKFNLILRNAHDKLKASSHFVDVIGGQVYKDVSKATNQWPLVAAGAPHGDVVEANGRELKSGYVYVRKDAGGGTGEHDLGRAGYTGVGYDRVAVKSDANGGTPGFDNGASKDKIAGLTTGDITISEIMVDTGPARQSLAQWIELHNSSMTQAVNLNGWKLHIENAASENGDPETNTFNATLTLGSVTISPNQTVLIASSTGRVSDPDHFQAPVSSTFGRRRRIGMR